eukprot:1039349-Pleurochrysis_carterae.AAC.2
MNVKANAKEAGACLKMKRLLKAKVKLNAEGKNKTNHKHKRRAPCVSLCLHPRLPYKQNADASKTKRVGLFAWVVISTIRRRSRQLHIVGYTTCPSTFPSRTRWQIGCQMPHGHGIPIAKSHELALVPAYAGDRDGSVSCLQPAPITVHM